MSAARTSRMQPKSPNATSERDDRDRPAVRDRDHEQRDDVVDDGDRQEIRAQAVREARTDEREQPEGEGRVGRHRRSPAVDRVVAGVDREVDQDRHGHPAETCEKRQRDASPLAQLAEIELAPRLEPDHEEEEGHQAAVDPAAQVHRDRVPADVDRERRRPDALVRRVIDVRPDECRDDRREENRGAPGLGVEEGAERSLQVARPRRATAERSCVRSSQMRLSRPWRQASQTWSVPPRGANLARLECACLRQPASGADSEHQGRLSGRQEQRQAHGKDRRDQGRRARRRLPGPAARDQPCAQRPGPRGRGHARADRRGAAASRRRSRPRRRHGLDRRARPRGRHRRHRTVDLRSRRRPDARPDLERDRRSDRRQGARDG